MSFKIVFMKPRNRLHLCVLACSSLVLLWPLHVWAAADDSTRTEDIRRTLTLLNVVAEEYREGVVDGTVALPVEYEEAKTFLDEAETRLQGVGIDTVNLAPTFASIRALLVEKGPLERVRTEVDQLRQQISSITGVTEQVFPPDPPSASRGRRLYAENCLSCHGEHADGQGADAARLDPRPANFTDPEFMRAETPFDFFHVITLGKGTSAMPAWGEVLSLQDRWDLVSYLWTVSPGPDGLAEGQGVYLTKCVGCHGSTGAGRGPFSAGLLKPVPELDRPQALARKSDHDVFVTVANGAPGTPMPAFSRTLSDEEVWSVVAFMRLLSMGNDGGSTTGTDSGGGGPRRFAGLLRLAAQEYRNAMVPDQPSKASDLAESMILLEQAERQGEKVLDALAKRDAAATAEVGRQLEELSRAMRDHLSAENVTALASAAAQAIEDRFPESASSAAKGDAEVLAEIRRLLSLALSAYRDGDPRAIYLVSDAYFQFEPLERRLAVMAPDLTREVEARFLELRGVISSPGGADKAASLVGAIETHLDQAQAALEPQQSIYGLAIQSATIILREGFEVVLIIGALLAYAVKSGNSSMRRPILWGTGSGIVLSLATAYVLIRLFEAAGVAVELLEGGTMLLASGVLFFVSYWLISKAEAERWQRYIQGKVKTALLRGSGVALAGAAFLAVYREGVETVLFYQALLASSTEAMGAVIAGFAVGAIGLACLCLFFVRFGMRVPIRQFFLGTSVLLYYLAFVFAGKGVAELQEAGWVSLTPVPGAPRIDLLGLYPTAETLLIQAVLFACLLYAVIVSVSRTRRTPAPADAVLCEIRRLRELAGEIRMELGRVAEQGPALSEQTVRRLDTLMSRVTELGDQMALKLPANGGAKS